MTMELTSIERQLFIPYLLTKELLKKLIIVLACYRVSDRCPSGHLLQIEDSLIVNIYSVWSSYRYSQGEAREHTVS